MDQVVDFNFDMSTILYIRQLEKRFNDLEKKLKLGQDPAGGGAKKFCEFNQDYMDKVLDSDSN